MKDRKRCCGTCIHHKPLNDKASRDWYCDNENADAYGCETEYSDECEDYEERQKVKQNGSK